MKQFYISILLLTIIISSEASHLTINRALVKHKKGRVFHENIQQDTQSQDPPQETQQNLEPVPEYKIGENEWDQLALEHDTFEAFYAAYQKLVSDNLALAEEELQNTTQACGSYEQTITDLEIQIEKSISYSQFLTQKVEQSQVKINKIYAERCDAHQIFIDYYKNAKITLRMIDFLREAIENYSFVQLKQVGKILTQFMRPNYLKNSEALKKMLLELKQVDSGKYEDVGGSLEDQVQDREVGEGHIDDGRDQIEVADFESSDRQYLGDYKQNLISLLNKIEDQTNKEIQRRQDDEIELNERVREFVETQEIEINHLERELAQQQEAQAEMQTEVSTTKYLLENCDSDIAELEHLVCAKQDIVNSVQENQDLIKASYEALWAHVTYQQQQKAQEEAQKQQEPGYEIVSLPFTEGQIDFATDWDSAIDIDMHGIGVDFNGEFLGLSGSEDELIPALVGSSKSDDSSDGSIQDDDEFIHIHLESIDSQLQTLYITAFIYDEDQLFSENNSLTLNIYGPNQSVVYSQTIDTVNNEYANGASGVVLGKMFRESADSAWQYVAINIWFQGYGAMASESMIQDLFSYHHNLDLSENALIQPADYQVPQDP